MVDGDQVPLIEALGRRRADPRPVRDRDGRATTAARSTSPGREPRPTRIRARCPRCAPADLGRRPRAPRLHGQRDRGAARRSGALIDPHGGVDDLGAGALRVLHDGSFADDPTRALRAARYAARLGLEPEPRTLELLRATDLATVSADRVAAELGKLAAEDDPRAGFELLDGVGPGRARARGGAADRRGAPGSSSARRGTASRPGRHGARRGARRRARRRRARRGRARVALGRGRRRPRPRAVSSSCSRAGPGRRVARRLRRTLARRRLEISGDDLLAAGVPEGPAVGRGLAAALRAKLDGEVARARRGAADRPRGGGLIALRAWTGVSETGSAGSRPSCPARGPRSRPASAARATGPFESLNLGLYTDDAEAAVRANRAPARRGAGPRRRGRPVRLSGPRRRASSAASARPSRTRSRRTRAPPTPTARRPRTRR